MFSHRALISLYAALGPSGRAWLIGRDLAPFEGEIVDDVGLCKRGFSLIVTRVTFDGLVWNSAVDLNSGLRKC